MPNQDFNCRDLIDACNEYQQELVTATRNLVQANRELLEAWEAWDDGPGSVPVYGALAKVRAALAKMDDLESIWEKP